MLAPHFYPHFIEAGCDEAGRGCLAGSVYAAAVILPSDYDNPELNDSKNLSPHRRMALRELSLARRDSARCRCVGSKYGLGVRNR